MKTYKLEMSEDLNYDLKFLSGKLRISEGEVLQQALLLLKHAIDADEIKIIKNGIEQEVIIR